MNKPNRVQIIVATLSGTFEGDFDIDQKLQDVIDKAFLSLDIKPAPGDEWKLWNGEVALDPQTTIEEQHISDGATLRLAPIEGGGGYQQD